MTLGNLMQFGCQINHFVERKEAGKSLANEFFVLSVFFHVEMQFDTKRKESTIKIVQCLYVL